MSHKWSLQPASDDRRKRKRALFGVLVQYECDGKILTANAQEVSETGMRLDVPWELPVDAPIRIALPLFRRDGEIEHCSVSGRVVRREGASVGVAFDRLLPRHMLQLRDWIWRAQQHTNTPRLFNLH
jgi:hypothetical protein